ncbi:nucleoside deaminase [Chryseobacterium sp.]|uniref:nucleoside deaminase n=1 Tax=Chryseobacterium sp. TaxID=1871047 RepID=UPI0025BF7BFD|nr:nucleoside deaminase [Chryseobacterium sp.]
MMNDHESYMRRCIELGKIAKENGESPVGSILIKDNIIVAEGIEAGKQKKDITRHAEIEVIRNYIQQTSNSNLEGFTMYTTHEPYIMCSYVIRHHKISSVVWGISTGEIGGYSSPDFKILPSETISKWGDAPLLIPNILEEECKALHH